MNETLDLVMWVDQFVLPVLPPLIYTQVLHSILIRRVQCHPGRPHSPPLAHNTHLAPERYAEHDEIQCKATDRHCLVSLWVPVRILLIGQHEFLAAFEEVVKTFQSMLTCC